MSRDQIEYCGNCENYSKCMEQMKKNIKNFKCIHA